jgi:hypothetical protein
MFCLTKRSNGFYYIFYTQLTGKRTSISTRKKYKAEALKFFSNFKAEMERKENEIPIPLDGFIFAFLKYSESIHSENTTKTFKTTFNFSVELPDFIDK